MGFTLDCSPSDNNVCIRLLKTIRSHLCNQIFYCAVRFVQTLHRLTTMVPTYTLTVTRAQRRIGRTFTDYGVVVLQDADIPRLLCPVGCTQYVDGLP